MKLREPVQRYEVGKHGSEYIDYSGPALICPECQSDNVREIEPYKGDRNGDYLCEDCGCEFDTWIGAELTGFGSLWKSLLMLWLIYLAYQRVYAYSQAFSTCSILTIFTVMETFLTTL